MWLPPPSPLPQPTALTAVVHCTSKDVRLDLPWLHFSSIQSPNSVRRNIGDLPVVVTPWRATSGVITCRTTIFCSNVCRPFLKVQTNRGTFMRLAYWPEAVGVGRDHLNRADNFVGFTVIFYVVCVCVDKILISVLPRPIILTNNRLLISRYVAQQRVL